MSYLCPMINVIFNWQDRIEAGSTDSKDSVQSTLSNYLLLIEQQYQMWIQEPLLKNSLII